jgi:hypothetical protein
MGGNGDYSEKLDKTVVSRNTFTMAGGNAIQAANAYGITADSNTFLCDSNCSSGRLAGAWIVDNNVFPIQSATRDAQCLVTLVAPTFAGRTTSLIAGQGLLVNVSGTGSSFDVSATAGNTIKTFTSASGTITYTQAGCSGAASIGAVGKFWISQNQSDAFGANAAAIYVKNSIVDPQLTTTQPFTACGTANPACLNPPQFSAIQWCNNTQDLTLVPALGGTGAVVSHVTPDSSCP